MIGSDPLSWKLRFPWRRRSSTCGLQCQLLSESFQISLPHGLPCGFWTCLASPYNCINQFLALNLGRWQIHGYEDRQDRTYPTGCISLVELWLTYKSSEKILHLFRVRACFWPKRDHQVFIRHAPKWLGKSQEFKRLFWWRSQIKQVSATPLK